MLICLDEIAFPIVQKPSLPRPRSVNVPVFLIAARFVERVRRPLANLSYPHPQEVSPRIQLKVHNIPRVDRHKVGPYPSFSFLRSGLELSFEFRLIHHDEDLPENLCRWSDLLLHECVHAVPSRVHIGQKFLVFPSIVASPVDRIRLPENVRDVRVHHRPAEVVVVGPLDAIPEVVLIFFDVPIQVVRTQVVFPSLVTIEVEIPQATKLLIHPIRSLCKTVHRPPPSIGSPQRWQRIYFSFCICHLCTLCGSLVFSPNQNKRQALQPIRFSPRTAEKPALFSFQ